jgi:hypothetical protein
MSAKCCYVHGRNGPDEIAEHIVRRKSACTRTWRASDKGEQATHACSSGEEPHPIVRSVERLQFPADVHHARFHRESTHRPVGIRY